MSPQLKIIQGHLDALGTKEYSYDGLIESMEYAQFIHQRLGAAKKRTLADAKAICEMYQKWYDECCTILNAVDRFNIPCDTLVELHKKTGQFPVVKMKADINSADENVLESVLKELEALK